MPERTMLTVAEIHTRQREINADLDVIEGRLKVEGADAPDDDEEQPT